MAAALQSWDQIRATCTSRGQKKGSKEKKAAVIGPERKLTYKLPLQVRFIVIKVPQGYDGASRWEEKIRQKQ